MSCELPPFTLLRTEHGNVIARDNRDNQEFVFAECYSTAIAALILAAVTLYTERKAYEKRPRHSSPRSGNDGFSRSRNRTRYSAVKPCYHRQCSQQRDAAPAVAGPSPTASFWKIHGHYSRWLTPAGIRSSCWKKNLTRVMRLKKRPVPENADEKKKHTRTLQDAERSLAQARLSARRLALRHVEKVANRHNGCTQRK
ncbi:TraS transfer protein [Escherichia coli]|nr:TraS transfer protein [Escherichia coli]